MRKTFFRPVLVMASCLLVCLSVSAQNSNSDDHLKIFVGGTFGKPKIIPKLDKLALAQTSIYFKTATTREVVETERGGGLLGTGRKAGGGSVAGRITAYLETTDGELTEEDFQELADGFYTYFNQKLQGASIGTVDWNTIANTSFYKNDGIDLEDIRKDMDAMKKKGQIYTLVNANKGNSLWRYSITGGISPGFAFGKAKRAGSFSDDVNAPVIFMHLVVDFADIVLDGEVHTSVKEDYYKITKTSKWKMNADVGADVKVSTVGTSMLWNGKMQSELLNVVKDISSGVKFASGVSQDPNKQILRKKDNIFAKDFNMTPMVISTTKAQYKAAAKKALENYADMFIAKAQGKK